MGGSTRVICLWAAVWASAWPALLQAADADEDGVPDALDVCCTTPPGIRVDAAGRPLGDLDGDCDVDQSDFGIFQANMTGDTPACVPGDEVCDGVDNDCDCQVDELPPLACGVGICQRSVPACVGGVAQVCTPGNPQTEICNHLDDNCDGIVDNSPDLDHDVRNCGMCYRVCQTGPNAVPVCMGGDCDLLCSAGYGDCNDLAADGCETPLTADPANCGTCGHVCAGPHAQESCRQGQCVITACTQNFADCNASPADGCEAALLTDLNNCGTCGFTCVLPNAASTCENGICRILACDAEWADCDGIVLNGCETNTEIDVLNCGRCGLHCPGSMDCVEGRCQRE